MVDPGFPIGGHAPIRGGGDLQRGHFSVKMYVKMKELGPMGGMHWAHPPRSTNEYVGLQYEAALSDLGTNIDQYYWLVYNCQSNQYCLYHWSVRTIVYV